MYIDWYNYIPNTEVSSLENIWMQKNERIELLLMQFLFQLY